MLCEKDVRRVYPTHLPHEVVDVLLHLGHPLPHDGEQMGGGDGGAAQQDGASPTARVEEGEVPTGAVVAERRVHWGVSDRHASLVGSVASTPPTLLRGLLPIHCFTCIHLYYTTTPAH